MMAAYLIVYVNQSTFYITMSCLAVIATVCFAVLTSPENPE
jgi:hypothetical protein